MTAPDTAAFLRAVCALYGDDPLPDGQVVGICEMPPGKSLRRYPFASPEAAAELVARIGKRSNVYFETSTCPVKVDGSRLCAKEARSVGHLRLDVDLASPHRKSAKVLPATEGEALSALAPLYELFSPSITVKSGYGLQLYWCFKEPCNLTDLQERAEYEQLHKTFHTYAKGLMNKFGFDLDNVCDLARLMRIPGGFNIKDANDPRLVTYKDHGLRYNIEEIRDNLPKLIQISPNVLPVIDKTPLSVDPSEMLRRINEWREIDQKIDFAWRCKRKDLSDNSLSGQIMSFVAQVVACDPDSNIPDSYLRYAISEFYKLRGDTPQKKCKGERKDIQDNIIKKARDTSKLSIATATAQRVIQDYAESRRCAVINNGGDAVKKIVSERTPQILDSLSAQFGFKVLGIRKFNGEPPTFVLHTNVGDVDLGPPEAFASQAKFRARIMGVTGCVIQSLKRKEFDDVLQAMLDAAELIDLGPEASTAGVLGEYVREYVKYEVTYDVDGGLSGNFNSPVCMDGVIYIRLCGLREHLAMKRVGIPDKDLPKLLMQGGFLREGVKFTYEDGRRSERSCYRVPPDLCPENLGVPSDNPFRHAG